MSELLCVRDVTRVYRSRGADIPVLRGVSFSVSAGERVGLVGLSGAGKSTLARILLGLEEPDGGSVTVEGVALPVWRRANPGAMSVVFQNYYDSVNPMRTVRDVILEPLALQGRAGSADVGVMLRSVGLPESFAERYPHELSGGQLQRVAIARALAADPRLVIFDEAVSSLDVSVQAEILELLERLSGGGMGWLFISHDLQAVVSVCTRILFLSRGRIAEDIAVRDLANARSECARELLAAVMPFESEVRIPIGEDRE